MSRIHSIKKISSFIKKLKNVGAGTATQIIEEIKELNLAKYVDEIAQAIIENNSKLSDVPMLADICVKIADEYSEFTSLLFTELRKCLPHKAMDKVSNSKKLRFDMRLLFELVMREFFGKEGLTMFESALCYLIQTDKTEYMNVSLICSIINPIMWEIARIAPAKAGDNKSVVGRRIPVILTNERAAAMKKILFEYRESLLIRTRKACNDKNIIQRNVLRQERTRGDATLEDRTALSNAKEQFERLKKPLIEISETLRVEMPAFNEVGADDEENELARKLEIALQKGEIELWGSNQVKNFYETLLDVRKYLPESCFKESETLTITDETNTISIDDIDLNDLELNVVVDDSTEDQELEEESEPQDVVLAMDIEVDGRESACAIKKQMQDLLCELSVCENYTKIDDYALQFVQDLNTKINRRRLLNFLLESNSLKCSVIPFCCRFIATLAPVMPDLAVELSRAVIDDFQKMNRSTTPVSFERRMRNVTMVGELVKFKLISRAVVLSCFRQLVFEFRGVKIEILCVLIENCARFLLRSPDSHAKMQQLFDVIARKKEFIKNERYKMLIDTAYSVVFPKEEIFVRKIVRPPMHEFVLHLVFDIHDAVVDEYLRALRRINWADEEICDLAINALSSPWLIPFDNLECVASLLAGLTAMRHHHFIAFEVLDNILETIRLCFETCDDAMDQKAIACAAFFAELYNYSVVSFQLLIQYLYKIITFPELESKWDNFVRIRMVSVIVSSTAEFFLSGKLSIKMNFFITYLFRYYWQKRTQWEAKKKEINSSEQHTFPHEIDALLKDMLQNLKMSTQIPSSREEIEKKVLSLEATFKAQIEDFCCGISSNRGDLEDISEEDEEREETESLTPTEIPSLSTDEETVMCEVEEPEVSLEDLQFINDLDRLLTEKPICNAVAPVTPIVVPMQKNHSTSSNGNADQKADHAHVALMTRGKSNRVVLKKVGIDDNDLFERWKFNSEREKEEREEIRKLTIRHVQRMQQEENGDPYFNIKEHNFPSLH